MGAREFGKQTARRWTGLIAAAGIALTGLVGVGTYHALEATSSAATGTSTTATSTTGTTDDSGTASSSSGLSAGSGTSQTGSSGS